MKTCFLFALAAVSLFTLPTFAQVRVFVTRCEWTQPTVCQDNILSTNQMEWWIKEGKKKFSKVQLVQDPESADWVISWAVTSTEYHTPATATATTTGNTTTATINPSQTRYFNFVQADVRKKDASTPDHITKHSGRWLWSKPDKDAFIELIRFVNKHPHN